MRYEAYTDDAITQAMGIGPFVPSGISKVIRLLLKPSFQPELCVTIEPNSVYVVGLRSMLWSEPVPRRLDDISESAAIPPDHFVKLADAIPAICENRDRGKFAVLDGMSISILLLDRDRQWQFRDHPYERAEENFVSQLLSLAHAKITTPFLRNRIASCAEFVGTKLPLEDEPPLPELTRLLIVGDSEQRNDYLDQLRRKLSQSRSKKLDS